MNDRIKLAGVMGWTNYLTHSKAEIWEHEEHSTRLECPDPETDANDDYAVLEWERATFKHEKHRRFCEQIGYSWNYKIGDYARAAVLVLDRQEQK